MGWGLAIKGKPQPPFAKHDRHQHSGNGPGPALMDPEADRKRYYFRTRGPPADGIGLPRESAELTTIRTDDLTR